MTLQKSLGRMRDQKSDFSLILKANGSALSLSQISFLIKLTSLNALLLATRSGKSMKGYIVVTEELLKYADSLENFARKIQTGIFKKVEHLSTQLKEEVLIKILKKTNTKKQKYIEKEDDSIISSLINNFSKNSENFVSQIKNIHDEIQRTLSRNEQYITHGQMLAIHAKIESSASNIHRESFINVSSELESQTESLKKIINEIQNILHQNVITLEKKVKGTEAAA